MPAFLSLTPLPVYVSVERIADAAESGTNGTFRFTRTGSTSSGLTATFAVSGSATPGTDYTSIGTTITFPASSATVDLSVIPGDDSIYDPSETVGVQVVSSTSGATTILVGSPGSASLTIADNDTNAAPQIVDFTATSLGNGLFQFTGRVIDESASGLTITFGGDVPTMSGRTITTASDGTFTTTVQLQTDGSDIGTVTATTLDPWGLESNEAQVSVTPTP